MISNLLLDMVYTKSKYLCLAYHKSFRLTKPLPHFANHHKQWWTKKEGYCEKPKETSQLKYEHKKLMKNHSDTHLLNKVDDQQPPQDRFKLAYDAQK